jgi:ribosome-associated protein
VNHLPPLPLDVSMQPESPAPSPASDDSTLTPEDGAPVEGTSEEETSSDEQTSDEDEVEEEETQALVEARRQQAKASAEDLALALELAQLADWKKGEDVVILDLRGRHSEIDYFVIATSQSERHAEVIGNEGLHHMKRAGISPRHLERAPDWVCGDFGGVVLHVFTEEARKFYDLEQLWADAPRVEWTPSSEFAASEG